MLPLEDMISELITISLKIDSEARSHERLVFDKLKVRRKNEHSSKKQLTCFSSLSEKINR